MDDKTLSNTLAAMEGMPKKEARVMIQDVGHLCADRKIKKAEIALSKRITGLSRNGAREVLVCIGITIAECFPKS